mgnify:CR=1 FL=1
MPKIDPNKLWFNTPDSNTLCRGGGNGPNHPSQLYAIKKYVKAHQSFLDYGAGSATTYEAIQKHMPYLSLRYRGLDIIPKNTEWCKENYPEGDWKVNTLIHEIDEPNESWDVVYSRHVVDHMKSFEDGMDEHLRVAKELVIVVLWVPFSTQPEHEIKNIVDQRGLPTEKTYHDEYTNQYSEEKVMKYLHDAIHKGWKLLEITKDVGKEVSGHDTVICLKRSS